MHVWAVCLVVFQGTLLLAYLWAHLVAPRIGAGHLAALLLATAWLPVAFSGDPGPLAPATALVARLLATVCVPFFALSTTAVVVQTWLASSRLAPTIDPYPLYGASNLGSLVGLLAYPLVVEPLLGLDDQRRVWSVGYLVYVAVAAAAFALVRPARSRPGLVRVPAADLATWAALAAGPSALLVAVTNTVASEVGSFPLVWTVPLALYLGSFVLTFRARAAWRARTWWPHALLVLFPFTVEHVLRPWSAVVLYAAFAAACLLFHAELYRRRPPPEALTSFYLAVAGGGWLGGLAVTFGAPLVLEEPVEGPLVVAAMAAVGLRTMGDPLGLFRFPAVLGVVGLPVALVVGMRQPYVARVRSFHGLYSIEERLDPAPHRRLVHGTTVHGMQYLARGRGEALAYHHEGGPLHEAWELRRGGRLAVLGLGAGAMAHWTRPGETLVFYEIDPANEAVARQWFTYLDRAAGRIEVRVGDARLLLEQEADRRPYDVMLVDAFAGDAFPWHLATREAFEVFASRVAPDGLLVLNLSSRYVDLRPFVGTIATSVGWACVTRYGKAATPDPLATPTVGVACAAASDRLAPLRARGWADLDDAGAPLWTDDWSPVVTAL